MQKSAYEGRGRNAKVLFGSFSLGFTTLTF